ncbi:MAG: hypothetical protein QM796_08820 [Chthoniobacteraceae bacterium]
MFHSPKITRTVLAAILLALSGASVLVHAQSLKEQVTPFSIFLDSSALAQTGSLGASLPIWISQVQTAKTEATSGVEASTSYRFYLRSVGEIGQSVLLRVYFTDAETTRPEVSCWNEVGDCLFQSQPLGGALDLPSTASFSLNTKGVAYLKVKVPGSVSTLRGVFLAALQTASVWTGTDFNPPAPLNDPFGNTPTPAQSNDDLKLLDRVQASLDGEVTRLESPGAENYDFQFQLASVPDVAVITFEVLNADITRPLIAKMNGTLLGAVNYQLPDLADPAYDRSRFVGDPTTRVRYTGWMKVQKMVTGPQLQAGWNNLEISLQPGTEPVAIRNVSVQLKSSVNP